MHIITKWHHINKEKTTTNFVKMNIEKKIQCKQKQKVEKQRDLSTTS